LIFFNTSDVCLSISPIVYKYKNIFLQFRWKKRGCQI